MSRGVICSALAAAALIAASSINADAASPQAERGKYLVTLGGCNDCHTPGYFFGKPDEARYLGGSDVAFEIPGLGVFLGRNITPDKETGIGEWTEDQIVKALQTGVRPDGRILAPIMPWHAFAQMTKNDARAIAVFLKSVKPVKNAIAGPFGPGEKVSSFMFRILPPGQTAAGPPPPPK
jgi:mono/diheme cytochrome c family protein